MHKIIFYVCPHLHREDHQPFALINPSCISETEEDYFGNWKAFEDNFICRMKFEKPGTWN